MLSTLESVRSIMWTVPYRDTSHVCCAPAAHSEAMLHRYDRKEMSWVLDGWKLVSAVRET